MQNLNFLIVEDEFITALDIKTKLILNGIYNFEIVDSGEDAIKRAQAEDFDIILMDIKLDSEIDGIEAARIIRETCDVSIIYVSGNTDLLKSERLKATNPDGIIRKPIVDDLFYSVIDKVGRKIVEKKVDNEIREVMVNS